MPFSLDHVVPWGRTLAEIQAMVNLSAAERATGSVRILDCGGGPASFNAELTELGGEVVSIDPLYALSGAFIARRIAETFAVVMEQVYRHEGNFIWTNVVSPKVLGECRMEAMNRFLHDYPKGKKEGRYVEAALPSLPLPDGAFDLALSSHFLFLYSEQFDLEFHLDALWEMLRVAEEVRVFPLLKMDGTPSHHLSAVMDVMRMHGVSSAIETVPYEFQRGGNQMLRLGARSSGMTWVKPGAAENLLPFSPCTVKNK
ncbi:hypothetical protein BV61_02150 [Candidatus Synechococcus spongiarum LMB bulk15M]|uniref:SAM-dependent methyltransferase n=1 Tax=Candidatus Synechococcus spongiarum LMB bulk15M TaxID=1943582 RepID=A0A1T1D1Q7_9SYNE|nr:hypothetical protein BV61_02150 [Candidatus Synechococcus spongiarum LMB bulk15M]